ncbi:3-oxoacyl-[acyl-carrier-protein] reductase FabG [Paraconexibacter sp. AEG42_29]|uniref:3-oxoacyl-[acyl-carrier-protein] reductase FabG n=1 Tax=Paraconexibacter sp. AEG42_29 TaxID=2997339 RepID=A0AAU7B0J3_9ACTN
MSGPLDVREGTPLTIVTGASGAIGRAITAERIRAGHAVLLVDVAPQVIDHAAALRASGAAVAACVTDLTDPGAAAVILAAAEALGSPTVLVNNAGITRDGRLLKLSADDFAAVIGVNLLAPMRLAEAIAPRLPDGGSVINISSRAALGNFGQANYVAAKSALVGATRAYALRWAPRVRVNAVAPGLVNTAMTQAMPPEVLDKLVGRIPAARAADPAEIAETVGFLASSRASYTTGQVLFACGGRSLAA